MTKQFWRYQGTARIGEVRIVEFDCLIPAGLTDDDEAKRIMLANAHAEVRGATKPIEDVTGFRRVEVVELEDNPE